MMWYLLGSLVTMADTAQTPHDPAPCSVAVVPLRDDPDPPTESKSNGDSPSCGSCNGDLTCMTCCMPILQADLCELFQEHVASGDGDAATVAAGIQAVLERRLVAAVGAVDEEDAGGANMVFLNESIIPLILI